MKKFKISIMIILNFVEKNIIIVAPIGLFFILAISESISIKRLIVKFVFCFIYFLILKLYVYSIYKSYRITMVNKITHKVSAKWFIEKNPIVVMKLFKNDFKDIVLRYSKLNTYTHTTFVRKLVKFIVGKELAAKFRIEEDNKRYFVYENNGNSIILKKDILKINRNIVGEFSLHDITDNDIIRYYEQHQFYKVKIIIRNKIDILERISDQTN